MFWSPASTSSHAGALGPEVPQELLPLKKGWLVSVVIVIGSLDWEGIDLEQGGFLLLQFSGDSSEPSAVNSAGKGKHCPVKGSGTGKPHLYFYWMCN